RRLRAEEPHASAVTIDRGTDISERRRPGGAEDHAVPNRSIAKVSEPDMSAKGERHLGEQHGRAVVMNISRFVLKLAAELPHDWRNTSRNGDVEKVQVDSPAGAQRPPRRSAPGLRQRQIHRGGS